MMDGATGMRYSRDWAEKRRVSQSSMDMSRLYVAETTVSTTGANADNRIAIRPSEFEGFVGELAAALSAGAYGTGTAANDRQKEFVAAVAKDLRSATGRSIVIAGEHQSPYVHAAAVAMNGALGNVGRTVFYSSSVDANPVDHLA